MCSSSDTQVPSSISSPEILLFSNVNKLQLLLTVKSAVGEPLIKILTRVPKGSPRSELNGAGLERSLM